MTARGTFSVQAIDGVPVVESVGEIDLTNVHEFEGALNQAAKADAGRVVASLEHTSYLDSQGVRVLITTAERLATLRQRLLVVAPAGRTPRRILEIAGVEAAFPTFDSVEQALSYKST